MEDVVGRLVDGPGDGGGGGSAGQTHGLFHRPRIRISVGMFHEIIEINAAAASEDRPSHVKDKVLRRLLPNSNILPFSLPLPLHISLVSLTFRSLAPLPPSRLLITLLYREDLPGLATLSNTRRQPQREQGFRGRRAGLLLRVRQAT
jgi:hypothetical protein